MDAIMCAESFVFFFKLTVVLLLFVVLPCIRLKSALSLSVSVPDSAFYSL